MENAVDTAFISLLASILLLCSLRFVSLCMSIIFVLPQLIPMAIPRSCSEGGGGVEDGI
jgi:hypothetical protein